MGAAVLRLWAYALHLLSRHLMHVLALACKIMKAQCMHQTTGASRAHEAISSIFLIIKSSFSKLKLRLMR